MTLADRDLVDADHLGIRFPGTTELLPHILYFKFLARLPVETELFGNIFDRSRFASSADVLGESLGVKRVVGQKRQQLPFHSAAPPAQDAPDFQFEINPGASAGKITDQSDFASTIGSMDRAAYPTSGFFPCLTSLMTRAWGSPKIP